MASQAQMRGKPAFWLQLGSLAATGWLLWQPALVAHLPHHSSAWILLQAVLFAGAACLAGGLITLLLYSLVLNDPDYVLQGPLRTSTAAIWFAPAVILFALRSPAAIVAALVFVISATRILYEQLQPSLAPAPPPPRAELFDLFQIPTPFFWRQVAPSMAASLCAQTGIAGIMLHRPALAGLALAMSAATLTIFALSSRAVEPKRPASLPRSILGLLLTLVLAIGLTVGGMMPRFAGRGFGFGDGGTASAPQPLGVPSQPAGSSREPPRGLADGGFFGVILWPELKPYTTLIAPMPQGRGGLGNAAPPRPLSIPFSGEYWMFRWPFAHPPDNSLVERGNPADLSFSTTDHQALQMEARHKMDQPIAVDCCRAFQIEVRNADRYPGTVALELYLVDSHGPRQYQMWVGRAPVLSTPDVSGETVTPVGETLEFAMPPHPPIQEFDEFRLVFNRDRRRADRSAKLAIDRFILVPY